jgi:hypothetical protein
LAAISSRSEFASRSASQSFPARAAAATASARASQVRASARGTPRVDDRWRPAALPQPAARIMSSAAAETILNTLLRLPAIGPNVASLSASRTVSVLLMPMLHGCAFLGCSTLTLSTYCVEHELLVRALKESERVHAVAQDDVTADAALTAEALATEAALTSAAPDPATS